jgi:hypothetical protein
LVEPKLLNSYLLFERQQLDNRCEALGFQQNNLVRIELGHQTREFFRLASFVQFVCAYNRPLCGTIEHSAQNIPIHDSFGGIQLTHSTLLVSRPEAEILWKEVSELFTEDFQGFIGEVSLAFLREEIGHAFVGNKHLPQLQFVDFVKGGLGSAYLAVSSVQLDDFLVGIVLPPEKAIDNGHHLDGHFTVEHTKQFRTDPNL